MLTLKEYLSNTDFNEFGTTATSSMEGKIFYYGRDRNNCHNKQKGKMKEFKCEIVQKIQVKWYRH